MKVISFTLIFGLMSMLAFAQTAEHLSFKSVPIDGTLAVYVSKMKLNGFSHIKTDDGIAILRGDFAGYKDCTVGVTTLKQKDLVHKITVVFSDKDTWSRLSGNYFDLKEMLTEKYGKPSKVTEKFDGYSQPSDDEDRMYKVEFDLCKYLSVWETDKGEIQLTIDHIDVRSCFVKLTYIDKVNSAIIKASAIDDL